ncbi:MAG: sensor domain-containing diguanylate cyclase [Lachnospiraceae bacterium]|nr:sensor domain-containing diguanylate cyclase [Lachnospiraceae bacterium]
MNHNIDDEIIRSCFGDCLFLFYSNINNNIKSIRMMDEDLKLVWDKSFSRTGDYFKSVCELIDIYVHPEDRDLVKYIFTFDNYSRLMRTRRNYTLYYRFKKDDEYIYEKLYISKLKNEDEYSGVLVFASTDVDEEIKNHLKEAEEKKQYYSVSYALGREYSSIYYVDMESGKVTPYNLSQRIEGLFGDKFFRYDYEESTSEYIQKAVLDSDKEMMKKVLSKKFILSQLSSQDHFTWIYQNNEGCYCEMKCVRVSEDGEPMAVVMGFAVKDAEIRIEMEEKAQTDFQLSLLDGLSRDYEMVWLLRSDKRMRLFRVSDNPEVQRVALQYYDSVNFDLGFASFIERYVVEDDKKRLKEFALYDNLIKNVPQEGMYSTIFRRIIPDGFVYIQLCFTRAVGPDGEENIVCAVRDVDALIREENERKEKYKNAIKERDLDGLTGIRNRFCYENYLRALERMNFDSLSIIYIDADFLHELNNTEGHDAGDELIRCVAKEASNVWGIDNAFRIGGDEFVAFDYDMDRKKIMNRIDSFRRKMGEHKYSVSVGFSHTDTKVDLQELITAAEKMMYEEKKKHHEGMKR